jgi:hypothetical protein
MAGPKRREIAACDVFRSQRTCRRLDAFPSDAEPAGAGLKRRDRLELRRRGFQFLIERVRIEPPAILKVALDAAVIPFADSIQPRGVGDGQRSQHDGIDQREDCGGAADAERERQHGRAGEYRRPTELPECVADAGETCPHLNLSLMST